MSQEPVEIDYDKEVASTDLAILFKLRQCYVHEWFAKQEGLI